MKKIYLTLLLLLLLSFNRATAQDCLPDGITFSTQGQIDSFPINYPGCSQILGSISIREGIDETITHLDSLSQINAISGSLFLSDNSALVSLIGLENLTSIGGDLHLGRFARGGGTIGNSVLMSLSTLENLTFIGGNLRVLGNPSLTNLNGLDHVDSIGGNLQMVYNAALTNLEGLENLTSINGDLQVEGNYALQSLKGLENVASIHGDLRIIYNDFLTSLEKLKNLTSINGDLRISSNGALTNIEGLENLTSINGDLLVESLYTLTSLKGLENVTSIAGFLVVSNNPNLRNLMGLENVASIGGSLGILDNNALTSLKELKNLTSINGNLWVEYNDSLTSLEGLDNIVHTSISGTGLVFKNSSNLASCEVKSICDYLAIPSNPATISGNASGCNSRMEVEQACEMIVGTNSITADEVQIYPNPITGMVSIKGINGGRVVVLNSLGKALINKEFSRSGIDLSALPNGMYLLQIQSKNQRISRRIIKL